MRQYVSKSAPDNSGLIFVEGRDFRHVRQVLRLSAGDMLPVRIPGGALVQTTVCRVDDAARRVTLQLCGTAGGVVVESTRDAPGLPAGAAIPFTLFMFVPKPAKFDVVVRQAAECGVARIVPVASEFSQPGAARMDFRAERFARIVKEAREQSGSPVETVVAPCIRAADIPAHFAPSAARGALGVVLYERRAGTVGIHTAVARACTESAVLGSAPGRGENTADGGAASNPVDFANGVDSPGAGVRADFSGLVPARADAAAKSMDFVNDEDSSAGSAHNADFVGGAPAHGIRECARGIRECALVCGAEGGISPAEIALLSAAGFVPVHLETNVLRCETAALYGIAALQSAIMEKGLWQSKE